MMAKLSASDVRGPKFMVPKHNGLTLSPVRPRWRYVISEGVVAMRPRYRRRRCNPTPLLQHQEDADRHDGYAPPGFWHPRGPPGATGVPKKPQARWAVIASRYGDSWQARPARR